MHAFQLDSSFACAGDSLHAINKWIIISNIAIAFFDAINIKMYRFIVLIVSIIYLYFSLFIIYSFVIIACVILIRSDLLLIERKYSACGTIIILDATTWAVTCRHRDFRDLQIVRLARVIANGCTVTELVVPSTCFFAWVLKLRCRVFCSGWLASDYWILRHDGIKSLDDSLEIGPFNTKNVYSVCMLLLLSGRRRLRCASY